MMNICMALFRISLELITYIFIQVQRYLGYAEIFTSFFIHIYLGQAIVSLFKNMAKKEIYQCTLPTWVNEVKS